MGRLLTVVSVFVVAGLVCLAGPGAAVAVSANCAECDNFISSMVEIAQHHYPISPENEGAYTDTAKTADSSLCAALEQEFQQGCLNLVEAYGMDQIQSIAMSSPASLCEQLESCAVRSQIASRLQAQEQENAQLAFLQANEGERAENEEEAGNAAEKDEEDSEEENDKSDNDDDDEDEDEDEDEGNNDDDEENKQTEETPELLQVGDASGDAQEALQEAQLDSELSLGSSRGDSDDDDEEDDDDSEKSDSEDDEDEDDEAAKRAAELAQEAQAYLEVDNGDAAEAEDGGAAEAEDGDAAEAEDGDSAEAEAEDSAEAEAEDSAELGAGRKARRRKSKKAKKGESAASYEKKLREAAKFGLQMAAMKAMNSPLIGNGNQAFNDFLDSEDDEGRPNPQAQTRTPEEMAEMMGGDDAIQQIVQTPMAMLENPDDPSAYFMQLGF